MALKLLPSGIGATSGPTLVTDSPFAYTGQLWFVSSTTGSDSTGTGLQRTSPFATAGQAHTSASAGDAIVFLPGHRETLTTGIACNKAGITFISEGLGSDRAQLTAGALINVFNITAACVRFINIAFPSSTVAPGYRFKVTAAGFLMEDCDVECGVFDGGDIFLTDTGASSVTIRATRFTATANGAGVPLVITSSLTGLTLDNVTFDAGGFTWNVDNGNVFQAGGAITGLYTPGLSLLNGSNFAVPGSSTALMSFADESGESIVSGG